MLDTSLDLDVCAKELKSPVEQLLTPLTRYLPQRPDDCFAIDNGAFSSFSSKRFRSLLEREKPRRNLCRFVALPDVIGSAIRTLEVFQFWYPIVKGWKIALVAQDGQESLPIPWNLIDCIFVGGTTNWKLSAHARHIVKAAQAMGKWVHIGRINTPGRYDYFSEMGVDSIDGTGLSRYTHMRRKLKSRESRMTLLKLARSNED